MRRFISPLMFVFVALSLVLAACASSTAQAPVMPATGNTPAAQNTQAPAEPTSPAAGSVQINGAGATFPFPLYSKWFYDYAFVDSSVKFNYQSIGSGGGIKQITEKTVDFGASDAILNADQFTAAPGIQMFPTVAGAEAMVVNLKDADGNPITAPIKFPYTAVADIYPGQDHEVERSGPDRRQSRHQAARPGHHRCPPLGWLRHHLHLHRLSLQGQPGMEGQGRECAPPCNGRLAWAARAMRACTER